METKEITRIGMLVALGMLLSYIETLLPQFIPVPGIKLGLANSAVLFALYTLPFRDAVIVSGVRVFLSSLLFGNVLSLLYSLSGALLSLIVMGALKRLGGGTVLVSTTGGVMHNAAQLLVAICVTKSSALIYYLPPLFLSGGITGYVIGIITDILIERTEEVLFPINDKKRLLNDQKER